ncbi:hypothetical protein OJ998_10165 [Solirubrobacter taibaiensis]|nr:hypothetical protein [Solirubrobacter taibaiensis]
MPPRRLKAAVAGALAVTALATPAAGARPVEAIPATTRPTTPAAGPSQTEARAPTVIRTIDRGFDWGSAGIGAAAAAAMVLLAVGSAWASSRAGARPTR